MRDYRTLLAVIALSLGFIAFVEWGRWLESRIGLAPTKKP